jgi:hypothetical protein
LHRLKVACAGRFFFAAADGFVGACAFKEEIAVVDPYTLSAQFAAFVWFTDHPGHTGANADAAMRFARQHWKLFLPVAHRGLGRLLLKLAHRRAAAPTLPLAERSFSAN